MSTTSITAATTTATTTATMMRMFEIEAVIDGSFLYLTDAASC